MGTLLKIANINIEADKHLPLVQAFLDKHQPDVVCLQEVFQVDLPQLASSEAWQTVFVPTCRVMEPNRYGIAAKGEWGVAILASKKSVKILNSQIHVYKGETDMLPTFIDGQPNSANRTLLTAQVEKDGQIFTIFTTHFTWTGSGETSQEQLRDWSSLDGYLALQPEFVLTGDLNAPRGGQMGNLIEASYESHVPQDTPTTIDGSLHYAGNLQLVVDYFLTKGAYTVRNIEVIAGVSDHCALLAEVEKV